MELYQATSNITHYKFICTAELAENLPTNVYELKKINAIEAKEILWQERTPTFPIDYGINDYELDVTHDFVDLKIKG